jgi:UMP-CMP kinase
MGEIVEVPFILFMDADEDTMINRIMERSKTSGRNDDNIESLRKRF